VVCCHTVHVDRLLRDSPKKITPTNHDANLASKGMNVRDFFGDFVNENSVNAKASAGSQSFA
jgi:hypothetical protein